MTHKFGLLGEANYKEQRGHLESYFSGNNPNLKNCTFVNLFNQKRALGSIGDVDLILTSEDAKKNDNTIMSGSYIRPFTVEFGLNYRF